MTAGVIDALLALTVALCWLAAAGFARLVSPLDRLHCVTFVAVAGGSTLLVAAFLADGVSARAVKLLLLVALMLWAGAGLTHAMGRALHFRRKPK